MKEITIDVENLKGIIIALKGILPANYDGMDRLVAVVNYLESMLATEKPQEVVDDG